MGRRVRDEDEVVHEQGMLSIAFRPAGVSNHLPRSDADNVNVPLTLISPFQSW